MNEYFVDVNGCTRHLLIIIIKILKRVLSSQKNLGIFFVDRSETCHDCRKTEKVLSLTYDLYTW